MANIYLARLDRAPEAEGVTFVGYADDVRLASRTPRGARANLVRTAQVLGELGLRLNPQKTKRGSIHTSRRKPSSASATRCGSSRAARRG